MIVHLIKYFRLGSNLRACISSSSYDIKKDGYYLVDLTYEQFNNKDEVYF